MGTPTTRRPTGTRLRRLAPAVVGGTALGTALGGVAAWRHPDDPWLLTLVVWTLTTGPVLAAALLFFVTDRAATDAASEAGVGDVERAWSREAAETAFFAIMGGTVLAQGLGGALELGWLAPVGIVHVLVLGFGAYAAAYLRLRHRGA
ncbi:MAG: hypothetical protein ABIQ13_11260 [Pedococcus sp.]